MLVWRFRDFVCRLSQGRSPKPPPADSPGMYLKYVFLHIVRLPTADLPHAGKVPRGLGPAVSPAGLRPTQEDLRLPSHESPLVPRHGRVLLRSRCGIQQPGSAPCGSQPAPLSESATASQLSLQESLSVVDLCRRPHVRRHLPEI